jgi:uridine kinase
MVFKTPSGKIELWSSKLAELGFDGVPRYEPTDDPPPGSFRLVNGRSPYHTFTRTMNNDWLLERYPENPVWIIQQGGHYGSANSLALEVAGITADTPDPPGGLIGRDERGELDFEILEALNLPLLARNLEKLTSGVPVQLPRYDFKLGKSTPGEKVQLKKGQLIILEGIHGMNPRLIPQSLRAQSYRIYISALTQLNLDRHNRVSTTDTRLIRRIVRDARTRGYSAQETIARWESVRRGEKRYIFPYQENADVMFNSALVYELAALKPLAEPILRQVPFGTDEHIEAKRLLQANHFSHIPTYFCRVNIYATDQFQVGAFGDVAGYRAADRAEAVLNNANLG